jgi:hypothetical protein
MAAVTAAAFVPMRTIRPANRVAVLLVVLRDHLVAVGQHRPNHAIAQLSRGSHVACAGVCFGTEPLLGGPATRYHRRL